MDHPRELRDDSAYNDPIQQTLKRCIRFNHNQNDEKLMNLSLIFNRYPEKQDAVDLELNDQLSFIILLPITTLDNFLQKNNDNSMIHKIAYYISNELLKIHSLGLYHGEISAKSIGIYYDSKHKTYLPSFILFYVFFRGLIKQKPKSKNLDLTNDELQQKDINDFNSLLRQMDEGTNAIPKEIYCSSKKSIYIFYKVYNFEKRRSFPIQKYIDCKQYSLDCNYVEHSLKDDILLFLNQLKLNESII